MGRSTRLVLFALAATAVLAVSSPLPALAERTQSNLVLIREDDVITEDLYAAGDVVLIQGTVEGDLVVAAFTEVRIEGEVEGSVIALTSNLVIDGVVGGSVRAVAPDVLIDGTVGGDVFVAAWATEIGSGAAIARDLLAWGNRVDVVGSVGRNLEGQFRSGTINARVSGDVDITVGNLVVGPGAAISGDLAYVGDDDATISTDAEIGGSVLAERTLPPNVRVTAIALLIRTLLALTILGLGLGIIWAAPDRSRSAAGNLARRPLIALAWGVGLASIPVAMVLIVGVFVALSPPATGLPLVAIFAPLVLAAFGVLLVALLTAPVPIGAAIGSRLRPGMVGLRVVRHRGDHLDRAVIGSGGWRSADAAGSPDRAGRLDDGRAVRRREWLRR